MSESPRRLQYGIAAMLAVTAIVAVLLSLWPRPGSFTPLGHALLALWVIVTLGLWGGAVRTIVAFSRRAGSYSPSEVGRHYVAFTLAVVGGIAPTACLGFYRLVFGSGGSNVAQFASSEGMDLWSIWFHAWIPLWYLSPASVVVILASYLVFFRPRKDAALFVMRACGLGSALISTWVVNTYFPDA